MNERELRQMASYMPKVDTSRLEALVAIACAAGLPEKTLYLDVREWDDPLIDAIESLSTTSVKLRDRVICSCEVGLVTAWRVEIMYHVFDLTAPQSITES